jgi:hypothetical protein
MVEGRKNKKPDRFMHSPGESIIMTLEQTLEGINYNRRSKACQNITGAYYSWRNVARTFGRFFPTRVLFNQQLSGGEV